MERGMVEVHSERNGGRIKRWPVGALESKRSGEKRGMNGAERDRGRGKRINSCFRDHLPFYMEKTYGLVVIDINCSRLISF